MWTVIFESGNRKKIDKLIEILNENEIITMRRKSGEKDFDGDAYEILVPHTELEKAQDIICDTELNGIK